MRRNIIGNPLEKIIAITKSVNKTSVIWNLRTEEITSNEDTQEIETIVYNFTDNSSFICGRLKTLELC